MVNKSSPEKSFLHLKINYDKFSYIFQNTKSGTFGQKSKNNLSKATYNISFYSLIILKVLVGFSTVNI